MEQAINFINSETFETILMNSTSGLKLLHRYDYCDDVILHDIPHNHRRLVMQPDFSFLALNENFVA